MLQANYIYLIGADLAGTQVVVGGIYAGNPTNCTIACDATPGCTYTVYVAYLALPPSTAADCFLKSSYGTTFTSGTTQVRYPLQCTPCCLGCVL